MHSKSMHPTIFPKVNLGVVRASKNVEKTYLLSSNNKKGKLSKAAELELYRNSLKRDNLVISGVL